ncbi:DNA gyrase inhibitor YacG [Sphingomonas sp.]|uniref:DNA gyrase inhibitor YacG n=1 Tax=Sphingomonas sp. TaxID=28214 RepID=UPI002600EE70|nr:DNA gyrase inhibitor YacG [Sphingomonas sp.]
MQPKPDKSACAVCGKLASAPHKPFCSQGCRDRDLLQWLGEGYRIPMSAEEPEGGPDGALDIGWRPPL